MNYFYEICNRLITKPTAHSGNIYSRSQTSRHTKALSMAINESSSRKHDYKVLMYTDRHVSCVDGMADVRKVHQCQELEGTVEELRLLVMRGARTDRGVRASHLPFLDALNALTANRTLDAFQLMVMVDDSIEQCNLKCAVSMFHYAGRNERRDLIDYLLDLGIDPNIRTDEDSNVLLSALPDTSIDFFRYLVLVCGVNPKEGGINIYYYIKPQTVRNSVDNSVAQKLKDVATKMRFCLLRGADWLDKTWFNAPAFMVSDLLSGIPCHSCLKVVLESMAMREVMNLPVEKSSRQMVYNDKFCGEYIRICLAELTAMKDLQFYNNVTILNILTDSDAQMMGYMRNEELLKAFFEFVSADSFPIYLTTLLERVDNFLFLVNIQQKAVKRLYRTLGSVVNYEGVEEIAKHLSMRELYKFSKFNTD